MDDASHDLARFLLRNCCIGVVVGWAVLAALLYFNVGRLRELIWADDEGSIALLLAAVGFAVTFGSLGMGTAVFLLRKE